MLIIKGIRGALQPFCKMDVAVVLVKLLSSLRAAFRTAMLACEGLAPA
jgi:hypothetical protein